MINVSAQKITQNPGAGVKSTDRKIAYIGQTSSSYKKTTSEFNTGIIILSKQPI